MPVYALSKLLRFPPVEEADEDGLLAVGGDLTPARLLLAYRMGIFPWFEASSPILWWSPDPRFVLFPGRLRVSHTMQRLLRHCPWTVTWDRAFSTVIAQCRRVPRRGQDGTWITPAMQAAYGRLHEMGYAHSVEVWAGDELVGGLYGLSLGKAFFGESMFMRRANASKVAFVHLVRTLARLGYDLIDCQVETAHLASLGAEAIPRREFVRKLEASLGEATRCGNWGDLAAQ